MFRASALEPDSHEADSHDAVSHEPASPEAVSLQGRGRSSVDALHMERPSLLAGLSLRSPWLGGAQRRTS